MPIAYLGADSINATTGNGSDTGVVIPSGATVCVILQTFYDGGATSLSTVTVDGQSATFYQNTSVSGFTSAVNAAIATGFTTGTKTVSWTYNSDQAIDEGGYIYLLFFSGASATPVTTASDAQESSTAVSIAMNNTATTQYGIVLGEAFDGSDPAINTPTGSSLTLVYDRDFQNSHETDVGYYTYTTTGSKTYEIANENYSSIIGVILEESTGVSVSDVNFNATNRGILRGTGRGSR